MDFSIIFFFLLYWYFGMLFNKFDLVFIRKLDIELIDVVYI